MAKGNKGRLLGCWRRKRTPKSQTDEQAEVAQSDKEEEEEQKAEDKVAEDMAQEAPPQEKGGDKKHYTQVSAAGSRVRAKYRDTAV